MEKKILDWEKYKEAARQTVAEGIVLLQNNNEVLPYKKGAKVAVFGRIQNHYYKSGTGSGGMVNVAKVTGIVEGLLEDGSVEINETLRKVYADWELENPFNMGIGWGTEPWSQTEMEVSLELVKKIAEESEHALVIIGRTAGEDHDNEDKKGAYRLTDIEEDMLKKVRKFFSKMTVLLNVGSIVDMSFVDTCNPDAVLYVWQGGMYGGLGVADVLTGKVSPSGKLSDTIAYSIEDYPSSGNFGNPDRDYYVEDIYVGYRYFETFAREKVRYPFGFGLSYTTFSIKTQKFQVSKDTVTCEIEVTNTGKVKGKEVVQLYLHAPQGALGKPELTLVGFEKTKELEPLEKQLLTFQVDFRSLSSYDDSGVTGHKSCMVLEAGNYEIYAGSSVRNVEAAGSFPLTQLIVTEELEEALAPVCCFRRMKPRKTENESMELTWEEVPKRTVDMQERRIKNRSLELPFSEEKHTLDEVLAGTVSMDNFIGQLSEEELACIIRGEGMGSTLVTPGTAAAFGGVSKTLREKGIPAVCCTDGPSGMRLDTGIHAFSLPNGTLIACTFHKELAETLFTYTGMEMVKNRIEVLLGPGMNIHRHPLNGRNFEYFSEDPLVTGVLAASQLKGLAKSGVTGSMKHFCGNNQETYRHDVDSVVSERALREIYLKGYEIGVKEGKATVVMTTYGSVNGLWTAGNYDLNTTILRKQWGFQGIVMTDWWAKVNEEGEEANRTNRGAMAASQNDIYMVNANAETNSEQDNTLEALQKGRITKGELQRCAKNICEFAMNSQAMKRLLHQETVVEVIHQPEEELSMMSAEVETFALENHLTIPLEHIPVKKDSAYAFGIQISRDSRYRVSLTGKSDASEVAQLPVALFYSGTPVAMYTFHGTCGKWVTLENEVFLETRIQAYKLSFRQNGLELRDITFEKIEESESGK